MMSLGNRKIYFIFIFVLVISTSFISTQILMNYGAIDRSFDENPSFQGHFIFTRKDFPSLKCDEIPEAMNFTLPSVNSNINASFQILFLGDSFTRGTSKISRNKTYPNRLDRILDRNMEKSFRAVDLSKGSLEMNQKVKTFERSIDKVDPDIIILQYWIDDSLNYEKIKKYFVRKTRDYCKRHSIIPSKLVKEYHKEAWKMRWQKVNEKSPSERNINISRAHYRNLVLPMKRLEQKANNSEIIFLLLNPPDVKYSGFKGVDLKRIADKLGWKVIDMQDIYKNYKISRIKISTNDPHPTEFTHGLIADRLFSEIEDIACNSTSRNLSNFCQNFRDKH